MGITAAAIYSFRSPAQGRRSTETGFRFRQYRRPYFYARTGLRLRAQARALEGSGSGLRAQARALEGSGSGLRLEPSRAQGSGLRLEPSRAQARGLRGYFRPVAVIKTQSDENILDNSEKLSMGFST